MELSSGTAAKTRVLVGAMRKRGNFTRYVPVDVTESMVRDSAVALIDAFPGLRVHGVVGDFERHLARVPAPTGPRLVLSSGARWGTSCPAVAVASCVSSRACCTRATSS